MSALPSLEVTDLGVRFRIPRQRIASFKEYVLHRLLRGIEYHELWALRSVDLQVEAGEVLGVIGRNGSGKSTLLKVLSRVLRPTTGRVLVRGRVSTVLELGAGFHADMTGEENIYINASMLGLPRAAVRERFDEVVEFAELAEFIDSPVRTYSSGMVARLGFSVATLSRPDVLLIDEVLAVGDMAFQQKCLKRLEGFRSEGTSVVLISHDLGSVERLCDRAVWLDHGEVRSLGVAGEVTEAYRAALG
jgi:homopolymeric O-antigen transport system ATP-binding protein